MKKAWILYLAVVAGVVSVVLLAWARRDTYVPVAAGHPAPAFLAHDLQGNPTGLESFRGKVILLNLWATWCTPCKEEMPSMQRLYDQVDDEGFEVVAVSIDLAPDARPGENPLGGKLKAFTDSLGLTFTVLHDPAGTIAETYQTAGVPESFVIDGSGVIVREVPGPLAWDRPEEVEFIRRLLGG
jgi:peroxiredoxin